MSIAVGRSIGGCYRFLAAKIVRVLGLNWFPTVLLALAGMALLARMTSPPSALAALPLWPAIDAIGVVIVTAFFGAAMCVALMREAFGFHDEAVAIHFVFGRRELRLFLAFLRLAALQFVSAVAVATVASLILWLGLPKLLERLPAGSPSAWHGVSLVSFVAGGTLAVTASVAVFLWIRFGFFLPAVAAVEDKASLARAWKLSGGNFWRALLVAAAIAVPIDILVRGFEFALYGDELRKIAEHAAPSAQIVHALLAWFVAHAAVFAWIGAVMLAVLSSLFAGATEIAYRARTGEVERMHEATHSHVEPLVETLPFVPAMAAPPLDVTLGNHARVTQTHAEARIEAGEIAHEAASEHGDAPSGAMHEPASDHRFAESSHAAARAVPEANDDAERRSSSPDAVEAVNGPHRGSDEVAKEEEALPTGDSAPEASLEDVPPQHAEDSVPAEEKILEPAA